MGRQDPPQGHGIRYSLTRAFSQSFGDALMTVSPSATQMRCLRSSAGPTRSPVASRPQAAPLIVYPLDYARTLPASDTGSGMRSFNGLGDCAVKIAKGPGRPLAPYGVISKDSDVRVQGYFYYAAIEAGDPRSRICALAARRSTAPGRSSRAMLTSPPAASRGTSTSTKWP